MPPLSATASDASSFADVLLWAEVGAAALWVAAMGIVLYCFLTPAPPPDAAAPSVTSVLKRLAGLTRAPRAVATQVPGE